MRDAVKTRSVVFAFVAMLALQPHTANARQPKREADSAFSFAVYGDSRPMMYLPHKVDQVKEIHKLLADMFDLVFPEKVSEEVVKKHVKLIFDPDTQELAQVIMPFETRSEVAYLTVDRAG
jgi:hypothetical protein